MQVKFTEDLFTDRIYDLQIKMHSLFLKAADGRNRIIPFSRLKHIGLDGEKNKKKHLLLETGGRIYDSIFLSDEDAENFLAQMRRNSNFYIDIRMDMIGK